MREEYGNLERAYERMRFGWQETFAGEWQKGRMYGEKRRQKIWLEAGSADICAAVPAGHPADRLTHRKIRRENGGSVILLPI